MIITVKILSLDIKKHYMIYPRDLSLSQKKKKSIIIIFKQNNCPLQPLLLLFFKSILHGGKVLVPLKKLIVLTP